ncbi:hypothetical protein VTK73DRAFT_7316 [Phialemonium thermophilum]|uniref:C2H2-type domain-containing protein n=1 Tax=Phialemonium thermophilum TaxID=223376 RepID=A0ABR3XSV6_9PEZI
MDQIAPPEPTQISETRKVRCPSCFNIMAPRSFYKHKDRCKRMPRRIAGGCTFHGCSWLASSRGDISDHLLREHRVYGSEAWRYQVPKLLRITRPNLILEIVDENRRWNELAASARSERQRLEEHPGVTVVPDLPADLPPLTLVQPTDGESVEGPIKKYLAEAVVQRRKQIMGLTKWLEEVRRLP